MNDLHIQRLEKVAERLGETAEKLVSLTERQANQQERIEKLEIKVELLRDDHAKWKNRAFGAWAVVTTAFTVVTAVGWSKPAAPPPASHQEKAAQFPAKTSP